MATLEKKDSGRAQFNMFLFGVIAYIPLTLMVAYIRTRMWNWFLVPYLDAPTMSVLPMAGIGIFIGMFRRSTSDTPPPPIRDRVVNFIAELLGGWLSYWVAYLLHSYLTK
jgi:hypothetical protein